MGGHLLSRLYRKVEALDGACLRAWGHPGDPAIRQELLSALEWDSSFHPVHAQPAIRELFVEVRDHSTDLAIRLRSDGNTPEGATRLIVQGVEGLRRNLAALMRVLEARRPRSPTDQ